MGAGRRTETYLVGSPRGGTGSGYDSLNSSYGAQFLCLPKKDLAAVIFGCTHSTVKECLSNQLFGLPAAHINYVQNIEPGMPLFLFNYDDRTMQGIYEATSHGGLNYNMYAWTEGGTRKTSYPSQVPSSKMMDDMAEEVKDNPLKRKRPKKRKALFSKPGFRKTYINQRRRLLHINGGTIASEAHKDAQDLLIVLEKWKKRLNPFSNIEEANMQLMKTQSRVHQN